MAQREKSQQRRQIMSSLIRATDEIICTSGMHAVTIRRVAQLAGVNSATIYNYFDDLDHLIYFSLMKYLKEYNLTLAQSLKKYTDTEELFLKSWETFCSFAFHYDPAIYYTIFFSKNSAGLSEIQREYYAIFPEELAEVADEKFNTILRGRDFLHRNMVFLQLIASEGKRDTAGMDVMNRAMVYAAQALLYNRLVGTDRRSEKELTREMMDIVRYLLQI